MNLPYQGFPTVAPLRINHRNCVDQAIYTKERPMTTAHTVIFTVLLVPWLIILATEFITAPDPQDRRLLAMAGLVLISGVLWL